MELNFERDLYINKDLLDEELVQQPNRMMAYAKQLAQAQLNRDKAKQSLDVTRANLDSSIRAELTAAQAKFTEAVVDGRIRTSPTYIEAQDRYHKAEHDVSLLMGAVSALASRRSMLENLVKLYLSGYWSSPRVEGTDKATMSLRSTEANILAGVAMDAMGMAPPTPVCSQPSPIALAAGPIPEKVVDSTKAPGDLPHMTMPVPEGPTYAIGTLENGRLRDGFDAGPFPTVDECLDRSGDSGMVIVAVYADRPSEIIYEWFDDPEPRWHLRMPQVTQPGPTPVQANPTPMQAAPVPRRRPR